MKRASVMSSAENPGVGAVAAYAVLARRMVDALLAGAFAPGQRLTERAIVEACGCTHAAAREVIHRLQAMGAVVVSQRRGARVISAREAPLAEIDLVWRQVLPLLEQRAGEALAMSSEAPPARRFAATTAALEAIEQRTGETRLVALLQQVALQREIVSLSK